MTLEEAIKHAEEKARCGGKCGEDHAQLAEWLKELQKLRTVKTEKRNGKSAQNVSKEDLISRKAAIDEINKLEYPSSLVDVKWIIVDLPSAQPERKTGRWIDRSGGMASSWNYCSVCGKQEIYRYDFCPNCGAYMGGADE